MILPASVGRFSDHSDVRGHGPRQILTGYTSLPYKQATPYPMATEDFHQTARSWAQIKHTLLAKYLRLFLGKTGKGRVRVFYVDAFAGPGLLDDGTKGSALHGAEVAAMPIHESRRNVLHCINIESDAATYEKLCRATEAQVEAGFVTNIPGEFDQVRDKVLKMVGGAPALFFIDPFGTEGAELSSLRALKSGPVIREALVRYDDTRVKRLASWAANHLGAADPSAKSTAEAFSRRINDLSSNSALREFLDGNPEAREALINGYISEAKRQGIFKFGIAYPIRNPDTGGHRYFLVHFSDFEDGYTWMANFMAAADAQYEQLHSQLDLIDGQVELFSVTDLQTAARQTMVKKIIADLPDICRGRGWTRGSEVQNRHLYAAIVDKFKWRAGRSEWEAALRFLHDEGKVFFPDSKDGAGCKLKAIP